MKTFLMYREQDFDTQQKLPAHAPALVQDLELTTLFRAMAREDKFLFEIAQQALLASLDDPETIRYRQGVLQDCLKNPDVVRAIYQLPLEAIDAKKRRWLGIFSTRPSGILSGAVELLLMFVGLLKRLRRIADDHAEQFESEGFRRFFAMVAEELDDGFFAAVQDQLKALKFRDGVLLSIALGPGNEGTQYTLRKQPQTSNPWLQWVLDLKTTGYSFRIHPRDDHGARALGELKDRGVNLVANALAQSTEHIDSFFKMLRAELAFYIGALNLAEDLAQLEEPLAFPTPLSAGERGHSFTELYDVSLALTMGQKVVGNTGAADGKDLVIITGANQGGKSTFLRSIGLAQLLMQCGMFVPAEAFSANVCQGLFTHYKREEDATMTSGKLDEELSRMNDIVAQLTPNVLVLFNESFSATNEREGSEIARQIVQALLEKHIKVFFVTHLYELARSFYAQGLPTAHFLRADRLPDGTRTFRLSANSPLETSYGEDLYREVFNEREA